MYCVLCIKSYLLVHDEANNKVGKVFTDLIKADVTYTKNARQDT